MAIGPAPLGGVETTFAMHAYQWAMQSHKDVAQAHKETSDQVTAWANAVDKAHDFNAQDADQHVKRVQALLNGEQLI